GGSAGRPTAPRGGGGVPRSCRTPGGPHEGGVPSQVPCEVGPRAVVRVLPPRDGGPRAGAARARERPARRAGLGPTGVALPAADPVGRRSPGGRRGTGSVAAPRARPAGTERLRSAGGGDGHDRRPRARGPAASVRATAPLARRRVDGAARGREPLDRGAPRRRWPGRAGAGGAERRPVGAAAAR